MRASGRSAPRFPQDDAHRWTRDLAAEVLHNIDPERYPLMTRWVWDAGTNTGVLREIWHGARRRPHRRSPRRDDYATFLVLREELSQFLSGNGVFRDVLQFVDMLCAQVYADYIGEQGGSYLRTDFTAPEDPMLHTRRLLGLDGIRPGTGRTRLKTIDGEALSRRRPIQPAGLRLRRQAHAHPRKVTDPPREPHDPREARDRRRRRLRPLEHVHRVARRHRLQRGDEEEIAALPGGEHIHRCWQCGSCTNSCTVNAINPDFNPRYWIYLIRIGMESEILRDKDIIWQCVSCNKCTYACPRDVVPEGVMKATAHWLELKGHVKPSRRRWCSTRCSPSRSSTGKIEEGRVMQRFFKRTGQSLNQTG